MFILDTNILSNLISDEPNKAVVRWLDTIRRSEIWTTVVTIYEVRIGLERMPAGKRRKDLEQRFDRLISVFLANRVAVLDVAGADFSARLDAARLARGVVIDLRDTLIAGIAHARRAHIVTRNVRHFADAGVPVVDPFAA